MYVFVEKLEKLSLNYCQYPLLSGALRFLFKNNPKYLDPSH